MADDLFGLLNINKPVGLSSRHIVNRVQRLIRPVKIGHAGTLDPLASGVLVLCVGAATRLVPRIQDQGKSYRAEFLLGRRSQTDDLEGDVVIDIEAPSVTRSEIEQALPQFVGRIQQRPPLYSAVKIKGRRAYKLARSGKDVDIPFREVQVDRVELIEWVSPRLVLEIDCGSGTYIRSIGRDLGEALGCGAVMSGLVRTSIGGFTIAESSQIGDVSESLQTVREALLSPLVAIPEMERVIVTEEQTDILRRGIAISTPSNVEVTTTEFAAVTEAGQMVAIGEFTAANTFKPRQVFIK